MNKIPRHFAYESPILERLWRLWRLAHIVTYREIRARLLHLCRGHGYQFFASWRDFTRKTRRPRMAKF